MTSISKRSSIERSEMLAKAVCRFGIGALAAVDVGVGVARENRSGSASRNPAVFLGCAGIRARVKVNVPPTWPTFSHA
jgi:hypothetical protein